MLRPPYFQFSGGLIFALIFLLALLFMFVFLPLSIVTEAFSRLGVTPVQGVLLLIAILLGRTVNIPVYTSERLVMVSRTSSVEFLRNQLGGHIQVEQQPENELRKQQFAVNLGGCIIPVLLSMMFMLRSSGELGDVGALGWIALSTVVVAAAGYAMVKPDIMAGLRIPVFVPAIATLITVWLLVPKPIAPMAAYVSGSIGTILGACVAPLLTPRIRNSIAAPVVSIGGSGTFGGIFLAGILAVVFV